jgi:hypothetical protein
VVYFLLAFPPISYMYYSSPSYVLHALLILDLIIYSCSKCYVFWKRLNFTVQCCITLFFLRHTTYIFFFRVFTKWATYLGARICHNLTPQLSARIHKLYVTSCRLHNY